MMLTVLKSKIHRVKVTEANIDYIGSITIDEDLMDAANLFENEQVHVFNYRNGARLITYVIKGERGSGVICMNGPAVFQIEKDDMVIIVAYAQLEQNKIQNHQPTVIFPKEGNKL
jgi:aspartate 1-decarboxylase